LSELKKYFKGAFPKPKGGRLFLRIKASFDDPLSDLLANVGWYHQQSQESFRITSLQCFKSHVLGFLLYSLRHSDPEPLTEELKSTIAADLAMRWMQISDGSKYDPMQYAI
jgi:hypothetical protein